MKKVLMTLAFSFLGFAHFAQAEPITAIRFNAKVLSTSGDQARVEYAGKKMMVPKRALASPGSAKVQEVTLSPEEYKQMKIGYFQGK